MSAGVTFDLATFRAGLRAKLAVTKKTEAEVLNQAGGSICANAIRLTPKATAQKINQALSNPKILSRATAIRLRAKGVDPRRLHPTQFRVEMQKTRAIRLRSRGYIAAGWFKALKVFRPGSARNPSEKGLAAKGRATKATASTLIATFENYSRGAGKVGAAALQQAMNEEGVSMKKYAEAKLAKAWK